MRLPIPPTDRVAAMTWVSEHLGHLARDGRVAASPRFRGGQRAADAALAAFDVSGYAGARNEVAPRDARGASALSPWIRHGLLQLRAVWDHVGGGPSRDVRRYRDELLWQEYARHWYARLGTATRGSVRNEPRVARATPDDPRTVLDDRMRCLDEVVGELERDGWVVNQTRMWVASHWTVRLGLDWRDGEDWLYAHLLDGSRAANRLGWQWTTGAGSSKPYGFSRWQVDERAPGWCRSCELRDDCPIEDWPETPSQAPVERDPRVATDPDPAGTAGPAAVAPGSPGAVWLTAESLGDADPALAAHPDLPAVFVFDEPLLAGLRLAGHRLVFLAETLADLADRHEVEVHRGDPTEVLAGRAVAVTHAPVPGFRRRAGSIRPVEVHPWPWLVRPHGGSVSSFSAWRKRAVVDGASGRR